MRGAEWCPFPASAGVVQISADAHPLQASDLRPVPVQSGTDAHSHSSTSSGTVLRRSIPPASLSYGPVTEWRPPLAYPLVSMPFLFSVSWPQERFADVDSALLALLTAMVRRKYPGEEIRDSKRNQLVGTTSAAQALPVQTQNVTNWDGNEWSTSCPGPAPRVSGTILPRKPCAGAEAAGMRWRSCCRRR